MSGGVAGNASDRTGCGEARARATGTHRGCPVANWSGCVAGWLHGRENPAPLHWRRQTRTRGFTGSQWLGQRGACGALCPLDAGQIGRPGFDRGSLQASAGPVIWRRIELRRGPGLRAFDCERSGNCGRAGICAGLCFRPLPLGSHQKCDQENVEEEHCSDQEPRGERPWPTSRRGTRTRLADLASIPLRLAKDAQRNAPDGSVRMGGTKVRIFATLDLQQGVTASYPRKRVPCTGSSQRFWLWEIWRWAAHGRASLTRRGDGAGGCWGCSCLRGIWPRCGG